MTVSAVALALYVLTLLPDFGGPEDSPKFQFLGSVLGTAHQPGYPLYVMLSAVFSRLPLGTVAYRVNLMSAVWGAVAVLVTGLLVSSLRVGYLAVALGGLGLATGTWFWWYSVLAEVYTLGAALAVTTVLFLARWDERGDDRWLCAAALVAGLAVAHHPVAYGLLPAGLAFVLLRRGIRAIPIRLAAACIGLFALGFTPYLYVLLRTSAPAPYLETTAVHVVDLLDALTLRRWSDTNFVADPVVLVTARVPRLASVVHEELGTVGAVLALLGMAAGVAGRVGTLMLAASGALGMLLLVIPTAGDTFGLVAVTAPLLWTLAAAGTHTVLRLAARWRPAPVVVAGAVLACVPGTALLTNWQKNDLSGRRLEARYFRGLHDEVPEEATFVFEDYWVEMMRLYPLMAERPRASRPTSTIPKDPERVRAALARGQAVFAFDRGATYLSGAGFRVRPVPVRAPDLPTLLRALPRDALVIAVVSGRTLPAEIQRLGRRADGGATTIRARPRRFEAAAGFVGGPPLWYADSDERLELSLDDARPRGRRVDIPGRVVGVADARGIRIEIEGLAVVAREDGLVLAVLDTRGHVLTTESVGGSAPVRPPIPEVRRLSRVEAALECAPVTPGATVDLGRVAGSGAVGAFIAPGSAFDLHVQASGSAFLDPSAAVPFGNADARLVDRRGEIEHGFPDSGSTLAFTMAVREVTSASVVQLRFGGVPGSARARLVAHGSPALPLELCAVAAPLPRDAGGSGRFEIPLTDETDLLFAAGWNAAERGVNGRSRWTSGDLSSILVPIESPGPHEVSLELRPGVAGASVTLWVNGSAQGEHRLQAGWHDVRWRVPASALHVGTNEVGIVHRSPELVRDYGDPAGPRPGLALRRIVVEPSR